MNDSTRRQPAGLVPNLGHVISALRCELQRRIVPQLKDAESIVLVDMLDCLLGQICGTARLDNPEPSEDIKGLLLKIEKLAKVAVSGGCDPDTAPSSKSGNSRTLEGDHRQFGEIDDWIDESMEMALPGSIASAAVMSGKERANLALALREALLCEKKILAQLPEFGIGLIRPEKADDRDPVDKHQSEKIEPRRVESYLRRQLLNPTLNVTDIQSTLSGFSKETFIVRIAGGGPAGEALVIRRDPAVGGSVERSSVEELPLLRALYSAGLPVPEPVLAEPDPDVLGRPFIIMKFARGSTILDPGAKWRASDDAANRAKLLAQSLAQIHTAGMAALRLSPVVSALSLNDHVAREFDRFESAWRRRRLSRSIIISSAFAWMRANIPSAGLTALVHGDASMRNMLVEDGHVTAVLDWELWHIGDPMEDLAYCRREIEAIMPWTDFLEHYYAHGGKRYDERAGLFYEMWYQLRNGIMAMNIMWDFESTSTSDDLRGLRQLFIGYPYYRHHLENLTNLMMKLEEFGGQLQIGEDT